MGIAFDFPERVDKIMAVDIVPTASMFQGFGNVKAGLKVSIGCFLHNQSHFPR